MNFEIIPATIADASDLNGLVNSAYRGESSKAGWTTEADLLDGTRTVVSSIEDIFNRPDSTILKYVENGKILGCVELRDEGDKLYLGMLTVRPSLQGKGIGKELLRAAEVEAKKSSCKKIHMTVISRRTELIDWYVRHGYVKKGTKPFNIPDARFGVPKVELEFLVLEKLLD